MPAFSFFFLPLAALLASLFPLSEAAAEPLSPSLEYAYKTYFRHHPPKEIHVKTNLYPFSGPIIREGQDIPVCAAAKTAGAYAGKKEIKYLMHGKNGWLFRTIDFRTDFTASPQALEYFRRLNSILASRGQILVIAFQPPRAMLAEHYIDSADKPKDYAPEKARAGYKDFLKQLDDAGLLTADLSALSPDFSYFPKGDFHWTPEGARDSAEKIAEVLRKSPVYKELRKQDFRSEIAGMGPANRGALEEFLQDTCRINIELTTEPLWATASKTAASPPGETPFPAVTLLGTSNSFRDELFNFSGSLRRLLRTDVYNAAIATGSFGASAYRYFASEEYRRHPPKVIIWEFLPQHDYNSAESLNAFRQMIPALYGACGPKEALAQYSGAIARGETNIFPEMKNQSLKSTYLYLEVTDPEERSLGVDILYKNGDADQVDLTRSMRTGNNNGKYYLDLGDGFDKNALLFNILTDAPQGHLAARLCQYSVHLAEK